MIYLALLLLISISWIGVEDIMSGLGKRGKMIEKVELEMHLLTIVMFWSDNPTGMPCLIANTSRNCTSNMPEICVAEFRFALSLTVHSL